MSLNGRSRSREDPRELFSGYEKPRKNWRAQLVSIIIHITVVTALVTLGTKIQTQPQPKKEITALVNDLAVYLPQPEKPGRLGGGGGGGDRDPLPASRGKLPKVSDKQLTPPSVHKPKEEPKLSAEPSVVIPPSILLPQLPIPQLGDPFSANPGPLSNGPGSGGGIGTGSGGGVGSGKGPGVGPGEGGGYGGDVYSIGGGVSMPACPIYPGPKYSDEAYKLKIQGTVIARIIVGPDGLVREVKIMKGLGYGLDEEAIKWLKNLRCAPGKKDGKPVAVRVDFDVNFKLF